MALMGFQVSQCSVVMVETDIRWKDDVSGWEILLSANLKSVETRCDSRS